MPYPNQPCKQCKKPLVYAGSGVVACRGCDLMDLWPYDEGRDGLVAS